MSLCIFGDGFPAAPHADQPDRCWQHQREPGECYPVIVTYTSVHVVWVASDSPEQAVEHMRDTPYETTDDQESLASQWWEVKAPAKWDRHLVQDGDYYMPYQGLSCDAHVEAYRLRQRELARTAEAVAS